MKLSPNFVWYSTPKSRADGVVSLLAVAETLVCVAIYWLLWIKWGVTWHHWLIVAATPLVLMRSRASMERAIAWFETYFEPEIEFPMSLVKAGASIAFSAALSFGVAWFLAQSWLADTTGWPLFWRSIVIGMVSSIVGIASAIAVTFTAAVLATIASALAVTVAVIGLGLGRVTGLGVGLGVIAGLGVGIAIGVWARAVVCRSVATFSHPLAGLQAFPQNWLQVVWHSDVRDPTELLPGHEPSSFPNVIARFKHGDQKGIADYFILLSITPILIFPAMLWRWSIKSTAWFYLPLLWVGRGWQNLHGEYLLIWAKGYSSKWINITGVFLAAILLCVSLIALILPGDYFDLREQLKNAGAPLPVIGWAIVLDWKSLATQPWQWFYLPSWVLTLLLFFLLDDHGTDIEKGAKAEPLLPVLRRWMWVSNARTALTNLGLFVALLYFLSGVGAWGQITALFS